MIRIMIKKMRLIVMMMLIGWARTHSGKRHSI